MFSKTLTLTSRNFKKVKVKWRGSTSGQPSLQDGQPATGDPQVELFTGQPLQFFLTRSISLSWQQKFPWIFTFHFSFSTSQNLQSWKWTLYYLACCSGREWVNDKRSFDPDIFLLFFLTGFSNFMIVCIDGKLRGSKSPSNSSLNCH